MSEHALITGQTGSGKTWRAREELRAIRGALILTPFPEDFAIAGRISRSLPDALAYLKQDPLARNAICYLPGRLGPATAAVAADYLLLHPIARYLVIDECHRIREGSDVPTEIHDLICEGRHVDISVWTISQRPVNTPLIARSESKRILAFSQNSQNDIRILADYFGDRAEETRDLPVGHYLEYRGGKIERMGPDGKILKDGFSEKALDSDIP